MTQTIFTWKKYKLDILRVIGLHNPRYNMFNIKKFHNSLAIVLTSNTIFGSEVAQYFYSVR